MDGSEESIAVVEPNDEDWKKVRYILSSGGYQQVTRFCSAEEAYRGMSDGSFDLVISETDFGYCCVNGANDYFDGFDLCAELNPVNGSRPLIFLTYRGRHSDTYRGWVSGNSSYLIKPAEEEGLLLFVRAILRDAKGAASIDNKV